MRLPSSPTTQKLGCLARLGRAQKGVAAVEFALVAPVILGMFLAGAELTSYAITRMRISQIALHVADNASRIGTPQLNNAPQISEAQINDLFIGADMQAGTLELAERGRVILSSVEPDAIQPDRYRMGWQRCYGQKASTSSYGTPDGQPQEKVGPPNQGITAPANGGVMFVEVAYDYKPLISARLVPSIEIRDTAAMIVRDDRDYTGVYPSDGAVAHICNN